VVVSSGHGSHLARHAVDCKSSVKKNKNKTEKTAPQCHVSSQKGPEVGGGGSGRVI
jgi:hypothetical protein